MTIIEALKNDEYVIEVRCENRYLIWHYGQWRVYEAPTERIDPLIIATEDEAEAVSKLLED